jgi:hypothetical protein
VGVRARRRRGRRLRGRRGDRGRGLSTKPATPRKTAHLSPAWCAGSIASAG